MPGWPEAQQSLRQMCFALLQDAAIGLEALAAAPIQGRFVRNPLIWNRVCLAESIECFVLFP
jgi:hypothetical protein